jgi:hypothetical protein
MTRVIYPERYPAASLPRVIPAARRKKVGASTVSVSVVASSLGFDVRYGLSHSILIVVAFYAGRCSCLVDCLPPMLLLCTYIARHLWLLWVSLSEKSGRGPLPLRGEPYAALGSTVPRLAGSGGTGEDRASVP